MAIHMLFKESEIQVIETKNAAHPLYPDRDPGDIIYKFGRYESDEPPPGYAARTVTYYVKNEQ